MPTLPDPGSTVKVAGGPHAGATGTVIRVRTDAMVAIRTTNGQIVVELYHLEKEH